MLHEDRRLAVGAAAAAGARRPLRRPQRRSEPGGAVHPPDGAARDADGRLPHDHGLALVRPPGAGEAAVEQGAVVGATGYIRNLYAYNEWANGLVLKAA